MKNFLPIIFLALTACSTTVECPPVENGIKATVLDHGHHSSLLIYQRPGTYTRYSFGDWAYYARSNDDLITGIKAFFWPTQAALGRKTLKLPRLAKREVENALPVYIEEIYYLRIEKSKVDMLVSRLNKLYEKHLKTNYYNSTFDLNFIQHPNNYSFINNSNEMVAEWLIELGCETRAWVFLSKWKPKQH